jgi:uncharacterized membrane protein (DUF2068 family)
MTNEAKNEKPENAAARKPALLALPGLAAIALYLLILAGTVIVGVVQNPARFLYLLFAVLFIAAALGLTLMLRWAWALAVAAVALMMVLFFWQFAVQHTASSLAQGSLNLVFFLYLVRTAVRSRLR